LGGRGDFWLQDAFTMGINDVTVILDPIDLNADKK
jgi:hypothetical protein